MGRLFIRGIVNADDAHCDAVPRVAGRLTAVVGFRVNDDPATDDGGLTFHQGDVVDRDGEPATPSASASRFPRSPA